MKKNIQSWFFGPLNPLKGTYVLLQNYCMLFTKNKLELYDFEIEMKNGNENMWNNITQPAFQIKLIDFFDNILYLNYIT
jgi:hypothetical protein